MPEETGRSTPHSAVGGVTEPPTETDLQHLQSECARLLAYAAHLVASPPQGRPVTELLTEQIARTFAADRAAFLLHREDGSLKHAASFGLSASFLREIEEISPTDPATRHPDTTRWPLVLQDLTAEGPEQMYREVAVSEGIGALAAAPVMTGNSVAGYLVVYYNRPYAFSEAQALALPAYANLLGLTVAVQRAGGKGAETKDHFLSALSHELRTPLTSIMGFTQIIRKRMRSTPSTDQRLLDQLDVLWTQAQRLNRLIDTLVDITRIESGQFFMSRGKVELGALLRASVEQAVSQMSSRHTVHLNIPDSPIWVNGDVKRLEQVFNHVIVNAIKYSPEEQPIEVSCIANQPTGRVTINVLDRGPGIPANKSKDLLEVFYPSVAPKTGGLGVGLYISRIIINAHGGRLVIHSRANEGTTVSIELPL